jgi:S-DNA-T family DNA segregation ATPase FtsK/SpoIIIE
VLGAGCGIFLDRHFGDFSWIIILISMLVGLVLAADELVVRLPRFGKGLWDRREHLAKMATALRTVTSPASPATVGRDLGPRTVTANPRAVVAGRIETERPKPRVRISQPQEEVSAAPAAPAGVAAAPPPAADSPPADKAAEVQADEDKSQTASALRERIRSLVVRRPKPAKAAEEKSPPKDSSSEKSVAKAPSAQTVDGEYALPGMDLLMEPEEGYIASQETLVELKQAVLQQTLDDFGVEARVVGHMTGPVITLFELSLAPGVKVSQIASLANDIARSLAAPGVRIVSPIPGKDTIGIEVPNAQKETVRLKQLMQLGAAATQRYPLPLYLGKDAGGDPIVADLASMPHMLMAGTTGSGKSVCINTIICSLLMTRRPRDVRLILVDPKMVEMAAFERIPHLLCPIVNDMRRAESILEWAATKMDERYELLKDAGVKNIAGYNALGAEKLYKRLGVEVEEEKTQVQTRLPYYVIIIDELADLIMTSSKEVEGYIIRIAQKARAVGIHMILATQRPSVNVVTGLIKSNMPCRTSFRVASRQESRIVLDQNGAEVLLGRGDMLFLQPGTSNLIRAQGTYMDDGEIHAVVDHLVRSTAQEFNAELAALKPAGSEEEGGEPGERDDMFDKAVEIILQCQRGSVSLLQRRLSVGYSRASRIVDQMAEAGILGDFKGSQARECLMTLDEWRELKAGIDADQSGDSAADGEPTSE